MGASHEHQEFVLCQIISIIGHTCVKGAQALIFTSILASWHCGAGYLQFEEGDTLQQCARLARDWFNANFDEAIQGWSMHLRIPTWPQLSFLSDISTHARYFWWGYHASGCATVFGKRLVDAIFHQFCSSWTFLSDFIHGGAYIPCLLPYLVCWWLITLFEHDYALIWLLTWCDINYIWSC